MQRDMNRGSWLGPHGLLEIAESFAPRTALSIGGRRWGLLGTVICTDHEETWLECFASSGDEVAWLAVEAHEGRHRITSWQRRHCLDGTESSAADLDCTAFVQGTAMYTARGEFGDFEVPAAGVLDYIEYTRRTGDRSAVERFAPHLPWLTGSGSGVSLQVNLA
jgi:hypothetical protein